jgi:hypothetical protein
MNAIKILVILFVSLPAGNPEGWQNNGSGAKYSTLLQI